MDRSVTPSEEARRVPSRPVIPADAGEDDDGLAAAGLVNRRVVGTPGRAPRLESVPGDVGALARQRRCQLLDLMARPAAAPPAAGADDDHVAALLEAQELRKGQLEAVKVRLAVRSGDAGRLFGSVTPADIASAIKASGGPEVDKRRIELAAPIKTLGAHETSVRLHPEVAAKVNIEVIAA